MNVTIRINMACKGLCTRYKAQKLYGVGRYISGQKRCQICEVFVNWSGLWCPCCRQRLRLKPRLMKFKTKIQSNLVDRPIEIPSTTAKVYKRGIMVPRKQRSFTF